MKSSNDLTIIVAGDTASGKSTLLQEIYILLRERGLVALDSELEGQLRNPMTHQQCLDKILLEKNTVIDLCEVNTITYDDSGGSGQNWLFINKLKNKCISWIRLGRRAV